MNASVQRLPENNPQTTRQALFGDLRSQRRTLSCRNKYVRRLDYCPGVTADFAAWPMALVSSGTRGLDALRGALEIDELDGTWLEEDRRANPEGGIDHVERIKQVPIFIELPGSGYIGQQAD